MSQVTSNKSFNFRHQFDTGFYFKYQYAYRFLLFQSKEQIRCRVQNNGQKHISAPDVSGCPCRKLTTLTSLPSPYPRHYKARNTVLDFRKDPRIHRWVHLLAGNCACAI